MQKSITVKCISDSLKKTSTLVFDVHWFDFKQFGNCFSFFMKKKKILFYFYRSFVPLIVSTASIQNMRCVCMLWYNFFSVGIMWTSMSVGGMPNHRIQHIFIVLEIFMLCSCFFSLVQCDVFSAFLFVSFFQECIHVNHVQCLFDTKSAHSFWPI